MTRQYLYFILICGLLTLGLYSSAEAGTSSLPGGVQSTTADSYLLDAYPGARAAYSLRKLRSDYNGPAIRVRRSSDGAEQDIGFASDDWLDTEALESFVGSGDGFVTRWYAQVSGTPDMVQSDPAMQPYAARGGITEVDAEGNPTLSFQTGDYLSANGFSPSIDVTDYTMWGIVHLPNPPEQADIFGFPDYAQYRIGQSTINGNFVRFGDEDLSIVFDQYSAIFMRNDGAIADIWQGNTMHADLTHSEADDLDFSNSVEKLRVGDGLDGTFGEFIIYPHVSKNILMNLYSNVAAGWGVGPPEWNEGTILPQQYDYQVTLYDWLETIDVSDVTLETGQTLTYDNSYASQDELADLWLQVKGLSAYNVTRSRAEWYVLDSGNGEGIEATGTVKIPHRAIYEGDPGNKRSWQNEPAYLYQLDIPLSGGGQGNPYYQDPVLARRAMVIAVVDLMMHHANLSTSTGWFDMVGKAFLGMAEAYRWTGHMLPPDVQDAFEKGMEYILDHQIEQGPRAVNTNMGMFMMQGAADFWASASNPVVKNKCVQVVKRALFGYADGELEVNHDVFKTQGNDGGVFDPSGFIMEGDQPDIFYGGESIYQIAGAVAAVLDRDTGELPSEWAFLEEVLRRLQEWRTYQYFYDPGIGSLNGGGIRPATFITAGAGMSGRTGAGVPRGQAGEVWKGSFIAGLYPEFVHKLRSRTGSSGLPEVTGMENDIADKLNSISRDMEAIYPSAPPEWSGWTPWTKPTPYLPPEGWYGSVKTLLDSDDPQSKPPVARKGVYYNKAFGGPPVGDQYWAYKNSDGTREWGFFVEAQAHQGSYDGWYGGKIETFWTETTGVVLLNRHGKTGCNPSDKEDSRCFDNIDEKAGHHVWGRDENAKGFTTLLLRGRELERTSTFNLDGSPPSVTINNLFNDPSHDPTQKETGEETGSEIEGSFEVENKIEALADGVRVTHILTSDETDEVTELWASLPVYLRAYNPSRPGDQWQELLDDTTIEYWNGATWQPMPEDQNGDGVPEFVSTTALRLGRDFQLGDGIQYAYVSFEMSQQIRLSKGVYFDPYQTKTSVRTVHIDLHGNPGTVRLLPAKKSVAYTVQTTDPISGASDVPTSEGVQSIALKQGWNLVSMTVSPDDPSMDALFADIASEVDIVRNQAGEVYDPSEGVNEIGSWNTNESYAIFTESDVTLSVTGTDIDVTGNSISLKKGWNWVPYLPESSMSIADALVSIQDQILLVKDDSGRVYYPSQSIDGLGQMHPGRGYKIYVDQDVSLTYPDVGN